MAQHALVCNIPASNAKPLCLIPQGRGEGRVCLKMQYQSLANIRQEALATAQRGTLLLHVLRISNVLAEERIKDKHGNIKPKEKWPVVPLYVKVGGLHSWWCMRACGVCVWCDRSHMEHLGELGHCCTQCLQAAQ
jgi:hypothetical protein